MTIGVASWKWRIILQDLTAKIAKVTVFRSAGIAALHLSSRLPSIGSSSSAIDSMFLTKDGWETLRIVL